MAQSLRQVRNRIRSIENTKKITRAMEMVSVAKLRSLETRLHNYREYFLKQQGILNNLLASFKNVSHPLLKENQENKKILLCLFASDAGLCSSYNSLVIHLAEDFIRKEKRQISLIIVGKKGFRFFKKLGAEIINSYTDIYGRYSSQTSDEITKNLINSFLSGHVDEVYAIYTSFSSVARHKPVIEKILNIEKQDGINEEYLLEPAIEELLNDFLPLYLYNRMRFIMLNSFTAEHSMRVIAMHEATDNAGELLDGLVLLKNKMRQANITKEIIEIISSADAMKG